MDSEEAGKGLAAELPPVLGCLRDQHALRGLETVEVYEAALALVIELVRRLPDREGFNVVYTSLDSLEP